MGFDVNQIIMESLQDNINEASAKEYVDGIKNKSDEVIDKGKNIAKKVTSETSDMSEKAKEKAGELSEKAKEHGSKIVSKVKEMDEAHPWAKYAAGSAIAAGLGAMALRKRLAKLKKK